MIVDTNALSAWADGDQDLFPVIAAADEILIPVVVLGEYYFGIRGSTYRERYEAWLRKLLPGVRVVLVNHRTADAYASLQQELKELGTPIPQNDCWIAAQAIQHSMPVISRDRHFDKFGSVQRIDW